MSTKSIPDEYDALIPSFIVREAAKAIEFYKDVFGATEMMRMNYPGSQKIAHAEIKIRNHVLMLGDENPQMDMFWGDRYGKFVDPFGHLWGIATHKADVTQEQLAKGAAEWGKEKPA